MSQWSFNPPMGMGQQGSATVGGGGGLPLVGFRSVLDARISMATGKTPEAQYPDGYLGSVIDRREDKLLQTVRNNARSYTRGVHKGSKIASQDYFWPDDFHPYTVMEKRMANPRGKKWAPQGNPIERLAHGGKFLTQSEANMLRQEMNLPPDPSMRSVDPIIRREQFKNLPTWR